MAYIGKGLDNGVRNQFIFAATQGQTAFSGADSDGKTLAISDILYTDCFQNGVKLEPTTDYTVTLTSLTLVNAASLNDVVDIVSFDIFAVPDTVAASTGGTFGGGIAATTGTFSGTLGVTGAITSSAGATITTDDNSNNLSLISTDADAASGPNLRLFRNSASPADNDQLGSIFFSGEDDGGAETNYAQIDAYAKDVTNGTEDGLIVINSMVAGTSRSRARFSFDEAVFNQDGVDLDFRVESDNQTHALFVQGSDGLVGLGTSAPTGILNVKGTGGDAMPATSGSTQSAGLITRLQQGGGIGSVMDIGGNGGSGSWIQVTESGNLAANYKLLLNPNGGNVGIGATSALDNRLEVNGGDLRVRGTSNPGIKLNNGDAEVVALELNSGVAGTVGLRDNKLVIDSSGFVGIGTTVEPQNGTAGVQIRPAGSIRIGSASTSGHNMIEFNNPNGFVGGIVTNGSGTAFNTSSDYRLKENVDYTWDATTRLKQLKPARFNFIVDADKTVDGFLAHEVSSIVPEAITGTKDAMMDEEYEVTPAVEEVRDADDNITTEAVEAVMGTRSVPDHQGIDQSKLVPLLVKTIQELEARITALEA